MFTKYIEAVKGCVRFEPCYLYLLGPPPPLTPPVKVSLGEVFGRHGILRDTWFCLFFFVIPSNYVWAFFPSYRF